MPNKTSVEQNNDTNLALVDQLVGFTPETPEEATARALCESEVRSALRTLSPRKHRMQSRDVVYLDTYNEGKKETLAIPIKSVPHHISVEIVSQSKPVDVPQRKDQRTGEIVDDVSHRDYAKAREAMLDVNYRIRCLKILHGLDIDLESTDEDGKIVWSADESGPRDVEAAIETLEAMDFTTFHLDKLITEIDRISGQAQQIEQGEIEKK